MVTRFTEVTRTAEREGKVFAFLKRSGALAGLDSAIVKQGRAKKRNEA